MGKRWTSDEEAALKAGVSKYGPGKWRAILQDAEFGHRLSSRSNVDLKDKWRSNNRTSNKSNTHISWCYWLWRLVCKIAILFAILAFCHFGISFLE